MKFPPREQSNGEASNRFLKIQDGEKVDLVLAGDMHSFFQKGFGLTSEIVGPDEGGKERYRHNVIVKDGASYIAKIWEFGPKIYDEISALEVAGWDLDKTQLTLSRKGSKKEDTKYTLTPSPKPIPAATLKELGKVELHSLEHRSPSQPLKNYAPGGDDEVPF